MLIAFFIFEISVLTFGQTEKRLDNKDKINFEIYDVTDWTKNNCNTQIAQYLTKERHSGNEIHAKIRKNHAENETGRRVLDLVLFFKKALYKVKASGHSREVIKVADVYDKDLYQLKMLEAIDYIKSVSKKKPTKGRILKYMARSNLKFQEEVLQMLLDNLEEEGILENRGDDSNQCFYLKESIESYSKKRKKATEIIQQKMIPKIGQFWRYLHRCQIKASLAI